MLFVRGFPPLCSTIPMIRSSRVVPTHFVWTAEVSSRLGITNCWLQSSQAVAVIVQAWRMELTGASPLALRLKQSQVLPLAQSGRESIHGLMTIPVDWIL